MDTPAVNKAENQYRRLFEDPNESVITLSHLFDALNKSGLSEELDELLACASPVCLLIEGSAFPRNLDIAERVLSPRNNASDLIIMADVSYTSVMRIQLIYKQRVMLTQRLYN